MMTGLQHSPHALEKKISILMFILDTKKFRNAFILFFKKMSTRQPFCSEGNSFLYKWKKVKNVYYKSSTGCTDKDLSVWQEKSLSW